METREPFRRQGYARHLIVHLQRQYDELIAQIVVRESKAFWRALGFHPDDPHAIIDQDWFWSREPLG